MQTNQEKLQELQKQNNNFENDIALYEHYTKQLQDYK